MPSVHSSLFAGRSRLAAIGAGITGSGESSPPLPPQDKIGTAAKTTKYRYRLFIGSLFYNFKIPRKFRGHHLYNIHARREGGQIQIQFSIMGPVLPGIDQLSVEIKDLNRHGGIRVQTQVHRKNVAFQTRIGVYPGYIGEQKSLDEASLTYQIGGHAQPVNGLIQFELDRSLRAQEGLIIELDPVVLGSPKFQGKDIGRPIELGIDF